MKFNSASNWKRLPYSIRVLLESVARRTTLDVPNIIDRYAESLNNKEILEPIDIPFYPARVLMQDFTGVPAIVDLAMLRDAVAQKGGDPHIVNPLIPVDLVVDHSVMVDFASTADAFDQNKELEYERNHERYEFLNWGQSAFSNFRVLQSGQGICHQINLELLASVVMTSILPNGQITCYPDTVIGTDSHTTMVNSMGVLGWGVGGIEAEAAMLGQPMSLLLPKVIGVHVTGKWAHGVTATDGVLTLTHMLRKKGVVGCFVEFFGEGLDHLPLADRATLANMAPEYGATCGFFPVDQETLDYLHLTGRSEEHIQLVSTYCKENGFWRSEIPLFHDIVEFDLSTVTPTLAGPKRPQDRISLSDIAEESRKITLPIGAKPVDHHDVVIAAITSCTNTSNPALMLMAGLVARKAREKGLQSKPWVKTSFAPGSRVVKAYLEHAGLLDDLEYLGFHIVGYGCTTCIGNSGPLSLEITKTIEDHQLNVAAVLSGNRNFEGRIHPYVKLDYLASPPLVVLYALAGTMLKNLTTEPIENNVYLEDLWPTTEELNHVMKSVDRSLFISTYKNSNLKKDNKTDKPLYDWPHDSTYIQRPPFVEHVSKPSLTVSNARILAVLGDSITTDHISPAGSIKTNSPAGAYLISKGVGTEQFNSYGSRRGNHHVMIRGTFGNIRLQNRMVNRTGGWTYSYAASAPGEITIFDAAMAYQTENTPLVIVAGKEYGTGSSRDWAAKGTALLGVKAVIAESFERIHRSNLVGMGVIPLEWIDQPFAMSGSEVVTIQGPTRWQPNLICEAIVNESAKHILRVRIDTIDEWEIFKQGGLLPSVLQDMTKEIS